MHHPDPIAVADRRVHVEARSVVPNPQHDVPTQILGDVDPDIRRFSVLDRVHHALTSDMKHQEGHRRRELDLIRAVVEPNAGIPTFLIGE